MSRTDAAGAATQWGAPDMLTTPTQRPSGRGRVLIGQFRVVDAAGGSHRKTVDGEGPPHVGVGADRPRVRRGRGVSQAPMAAGALVILRSIRHVHAQVAPAIYPEVTHDRVPHGR